MIEEPKNALKVVICRLDEAYYRIEEILYIKKDELDNLHELKRQTELCKAVEKGINVMENAMSSIEDIEASLEKLIEELNKEHA